MFRSVSAVVESASIDEAFLDLTGAVRMFGGATQIGEYVRAVVSDEQQITCSVGIGPTKFVAKVASRAAKPDGLIDDAARSGDGVPALLPVEAMWGWETRLPRSCTGLASSPSATLRTPHDPPYVLPLARMRAGCSANSPGDGTGAGSRRWSRSTVSVRRQTFGHDTDDPDTVRRELLRMADRTARRMRKQRMLGRTITISVRFADFTELTRSMTVPTPTDVTDEIYAHAVQLYERLGIGRARIRRVGVRMEHLVDRHRAYVQPAVDRP